MANYKYKTVRVDQTPQALATKANSLGHQGWECYKAVHNYKTPFGILIKVRRKVRANH